MKVSIEFTDDDLSKFMGTLERWLAPTLGQEIPAPRTAKDPGDLLDKYAMILGQWPANTIDISARRLTGGLCQHIITSHPPSSMALYSELMKIHGQREESIYEIKFLDSNQRVYRGSGRITLPDTLTCRPQQ